MYICHQLLEATRVLPLNPVERPLHYSFSFEFLLLSRPLACPASLQQISGYAPECRRFFGSRTTLLGLSCIDAP